MQKGYKRTGKAIAVLHFFIGLILVALLLGALYFFIGRMEYNVNLSPDNSIRPYVEQTGNPDETAPAPTMPVEDADVVDLTPTDTPEPTPEITATPEPTPEPTATPEPTPSPEPTPAPTAITPDKISASKNKGFSVPPKASNITAEITNTYVSEPNNNSVLQINAYAYIDQDTFDGASASYFLIATSATSGAQIAYQAAKVPGATHEGALCQNADQTDFEVFIDVSKLGDSEYKLGVVIMYKQNGVPVYTYHEFTQSFNVQSGAVLLPTEVFSGAGLLDENGDVVEGVTNTGVSVSVG